jgi:hypothetical protein
LYDSLYHEEKTQQLQALRRQGGVARTKKLPLPSCRRLGKRQRRPDEETICGSSAIQFRS